MVKIEQKIQLAEPISKPISSSLTTSTSPSSSACKKKKYKGVRMRSWGSWVSEIRAPNQKTRIWLGSYSTAEAAARAYDAALLCLKGSSANLNFPMTASTHFIPQDTILSPKSIQRVAAAAANSFVDNATTTTTSSSSPPSPSPSPSPPPPDLSSSSSSLVSSPSMSSSLSHLLDDDMSSLMGSFGSYNTYDHHHQANEPIMSTMESWNNFDGGLQSPKYLDQMFNGALFDPPMTYDFYEESDIRLWSFC